MYKITETSTVTIKVNPNDIKAYTHKTMADGDYVVRAYIDDVSLNSHKGAYNVLGTLQGVSTLDSINIKVVDSIDDDKQYN